MKSIVFFLVIGLLSACARPKSPAYDYVQYNRFDLRPYDIDAQIMLPNASAGIGTSLKPSVNFEIGGFKWRLEIGRNFTLLIEDYGDYSFRFAEFKRKLLKPNKFFASSCNALSSALLMFSRSLFSNPNKKIQRLSKLVATMVLAPDLLPRPLNAIRFFTT